MVNTEKYIEKFPSQQKYIKLKLIFKWRDQYVRDQYNSKTFRVLDV
jgi:hypothetical protein